MSTVNDSKLQTDIRNVLEQLFGPMRPTVLSDLLNKVAGQWMSALRTYMGAQLGIDTRQGITHLAPGSTPIAINPPFDEANPVILMKAYDTDGNDVGVIKQGYSTTTLTVYVAMVCDLHWRLDHPT